MTLPDSPLGHGKRPRTGPSMDNTTPPCRPGTPDPWRTPADADPMENTPRPHPGRHLPPPDFGPTLTAARTAAGLGLRPAARAAGISPGYWCLLEQGKRSPSGAVAEALIDALNATGRAAQTIRAAAIPGTGRDYVPPLPAHYGTPITRRRRP